VGKLKDVSIPKTESKSDPPQSDPPQLSQRAVAFLQDMEEFFNQLELDGCPAATVAGFRKSIPIAVTQTLVESAQRNLLLLEIEQSAAKLRPKRSLSGPPPGAAAALDEIEGLASRLPDSAERRSVLRRVKQIRGCLPEGCER